MDIEIEMLNGEQRVYNNCRDLVWFDDFFEIIWRDEHFVKTQ